MFKRVRVYADHCMQRQRTRQHEQQRDPMSRVLAYMSRHKLTTAQMVRQLEVMGRAADVRLCERMTVPLIRKQLSASNKHSMRHKSSVELPHVAAVGYESPGLSSFDGNKPIKVSTGMPELQMQKALKQQSRTYVRSVMQRSANSTADAIDDDDRLLPWHTSDFDSTQWPTNQRGLAFPWPTRADLPSHELGRKWRHEHMPRPHSQPNRDGMITQHRFELELHRSKTPGPMRTR